MNDKDVPELDIHAAIAALREEIVPINDVEVVLASAAAGRVLAADVVAQFDLPPFTNAGMDGYAVRAEDCVGQTRLRVIGTAFAGHVFAETCARGTAVRIMTGALLPPGADAVVVQEDVHHEGDAVSFSGSVRAGLNVRPRGEHMRSGEQVIATGAVLDAAKIGLATAVGATQVRVFRQLRVGTASTGDELADPPAPLATGGSYDASRPMLMLACRAAGFDVVDLGICPDEAAAFSQLIELAKVRSLDVLLISGGSALGDADIVRKADSVRFVPLNIRPGRGITFAHLGKETPLALLGLPGNAVAAFVMFHLVALPTMRYMAGAGATVPEHFPVALAVDIACKAGRIDYRRGRLERDSAGELTVRPLDKQGSAMLRTIVDADVLIAAGPRSSYRAGERILVVPLSALPH